MQRSFPWPWLLLAVLILAPGFVGRVLLDLVGGITLVVMLLGGLGIGAAVVGGQILRRRLRSCPACGSLSLAQASCPACGHQFHGSEDPSTDGPFGPASEATITVDAVAVKDGPTTLP
ncbi:MAG: hypothetical protein VKM01_08240 [Cyanobacteriota bacterium]|jgi:hypothetical protein|nr:hypothetical protein [Cyanobacteriota bacterium]